MEMKPTEEAIFRIDVEAFERETGQRVPPVVMMHPQTGEMQETRIRAVYQWIKIEQVPQFKRLEPRTFVEALNNSDSDLKRAAYLFGEGSKLFASYTGEEKLPHFEQAHKVYRDILIALETCPKNEEPNDALRLKLAERYEDIYFRASKNAVAAAIMKWRVARRMGQYMDDHNITNKNKPKADLGAAKDMAQRITTIKGARSWGHMLLARVYRLQDKIREAHAALGTCRTSQTGVSHIWEDKLRKEIANEEYIINAALKKETASFLKMGTEKKRNVRNKMMAAMRDDE